MIENSPFIKALKKEPLEIPPIWYMRQAGRYMPEYRAVRSKFKNFLDMCKNPDVCCELAMQPIDKFRLDASILFSDILTIPDAFGLKVEFVEGEGPVFRNPIRKRTDIESLPEFNSDDLAYVYKAVSNIRSALPSHIPLIGFCGSPWTLAAYSIEGGSSKDFAFTRNFVAENADISEVFLEKLTYACFIYLKNQVISGANVLQIFDSWANLLSEADYFKYSLKHINKLIHMIKSDPITADIPIILFAREPKCEPIVLADSSADCLSLFWSMDTIDINQLKSKISIQGNLNPAFLLESRDTIKRETYKILDRYKNYPGYIFNLGHGITPNINPENIKYLTDLVRSY